jgi:hypothetical protein
MVLDIVVLCGTKGQYITLYRNLSVYSRPFTEPVMRQKRDHTAGPSIVGAKFFAL